MSRILRIIATIFSCCACAAMIYFSSKGNSDAIYTCLILCIVGFFANMVITSHENAKQLEAMQKEQEARTVQQEQE